MTYEEKRRMLNLVFEESLFKRISSSIKYMHKFGNFTLYNFFHLIFCILSTRFWDLVFVGRYAILNIPKLRKMFIAFVSAELAIKYLDKEKNSTYLYYNFIYLFTRILLELNINVDSGFEEYLPF